MEINELEAFLYSVSHDLRAPLRHIEGYAALLRRRIPESDAESVRYLDRISEASGHALRLVTQLLSLAGASRVELHFGPVDLGELVAEALEECLTDAGGRRIAATIARLPVVTGDRTLLRQVFVNLIANAIKFTRGRADAAIGVGATDVGREVVIHVKDNGAGFDPRLAGKLFHPFQRLHGQHEFEGTGVGLATVGRIVARHGGRIWAEGAPGKGATFHVALRRPE